MNIFKRIYCRLFQGCFYIALPLLPYREPKVLENTTEIPNLLIEKNIYKVLLITDKGVNNLGLTKPLEEELKKAKIECLVYDKTLANPTVDNVEEARNLYKENNCQCLIAFGGGSSMDCAKAVGARLVYPNKQLSKLKGLLKIRKRIPLLIAIPTTAGTGSEVTLASVITDTKIQHKYTLMDFNLIPSVAVLDPTCTISLPTHLTSTTGMDALTHAVEAFIGRSTTKETRNKAIEAIKLIFENIELAYKDGSNLEARSNMLKAAYLAGIAFSKSYVGYVHAIAHSLGGQYNIPHGLANAILLPIVLKQYGNSVYNKLHQLAVATGLSDCNEDVQDSATKFINKIISLNKNMNIPNVFDNINESDIKLMAKHADKEANPLYPVPKLFDALELENIYMLAKK